MLDFTNIISGVAGQRETFEELVCQVARRIPPPGHVEFRRIHGAGGDGGVEAIWVLEGGDEHGYQAKFYTKSADVDWSAVDKSVAAALVTHPRMTTMTIALACSLTGRTARVTKSGKPQANGWDAWDQHKSKWETSAKALGRDVAFLPWTTFDLEEMLGRAETTGLKQLWFGGIELSPDWLSRQCKRTIAALEERYHPEDHVDVSTTRVFDGLLRNSSFRALLRSAREQVLEGGQIGTVPATLPDGDKQKLSDIVARVRKFDEATSALASDADAPFEYVAWQDHARELGRLVFDVIQSIGEIARDRKKAKPSSTTATQAAEGASEQVDLEHLIDALRGLQSALGGFLDVVGSLGCSSDHSRFALLEGRAGSGKSHLIASQVERALADGVAALFLLGTDFTLHGTIESQFLAHFELGGVKFDELLGALNSRAEALGKRALLAIDAVNEGAGVQLWRSALHGLAQRILAYPYLALCISCRREYVDHLVTPAVDEISTRAEVLGFETPEEMEAAARVYIDRRGIVRPATPWLNPEFSNPLFLRTACLAIERDGRTTFPRGMRGTSEVLNFLLEATGRHLGTIYDGTDNLIAPVRQALLALAGEMASGRRDYVTRRTAHTLVDDAFQGFAPPAATTWLELLRFRGLLRYDPNPAYDTADPLSDQDDVLRISFQRFQDHLVANSLLQQVTSPAGLFETGGRLAFVLGKHGLQWEWRGLFYALFLHCADRYQIELVDLLPGGADAWWGQWPVQDAFVDSVRWRAVGAFSDRTRDLLNKLDRDGEDIVALLIELAVVEDHPWNSELLDRNLASRKLPNRDAFWTRRINVAHNDVGHPLRRLINWCLNVGISRADDGTLKLALVALAWSCTSSSANLRDAASKAMIRIFLERSGLIEPMFARFATCDDPYVVERLYGALYGASLCTEDPAGLAEHALVAWRYAFSSGGPPVHLLTRDYARGTVELALDAGARIDASIDLARCRPPYGAKAPMFNITEAKVEARAKRVGADAIVRSCYKGIADFGRYTLQHRVERFAAASLSDPRPLTSSETGQAFFNEVSSNRPDIGQAFEALRNAHSSKRIKFNNKTFKVTVPATDLKRIKAAEVAFLALLTTEQVKRYATDASHWAENQNSNAWIVPGVGAGKEVNSHRAKIWVANRAIALGWTETLFPRDHGSDERQSDSGRVERIGKKYQRIAMMELLARLADNNWLKPEWGSPARAYDNPLDVEFVRDLEPSILPDDHASTPVDGTPHVPELRCPDLLPSERSKWVFDPELAPDRLGLALGVDLGSSEWLALYRYGSHEIEAPRRKGTSWDAPWEQRDFHFIAMLLMPSEVRKQFVQQTEEQRDDFHEWLPGDFTDGPYIGELGRRATWPSDPWSTLSSRGGDLHRSYQVIKPTVGYHWESHLDGSLPHGFSRQVPISWLLDTMELRPDTNNVGVYRDSQGAPVIVSGRTTGSSYVLVRRGALVTIAARHELEPVWTVIGERSGRTDSDKDKETLGVRVRYNGTLYLDDGASVIQHWSQTD